MEAPAGHAAFGPQQIFGAGSERSTGGELSFSIGAGSQRSTGGELSFVQETAKVITTSYGVGGFLEKKTAVNGGNGKHSVLMDAVGAVVEEDDGRSFEKSGTSSFFDNTSDVLSKNEDVPNSALELGTTRLGFRVPDPSAPCKEEYIDKLFKSTPYNDVNGKGWQGKVKERFVVMSKVVPHFHSPPVLVSKYLSSYCGHVVVVS